MAAPTWLTETDYCPLTGDRPRKDYYRKPAQPRTRLMPGRRLPAGTTDAEAEHARALIRAWEWTRESDGSVLLWVEM